jgi:hypothetical protein
MVALSVFSRISMTGDTFVFSSKNLPFHDEHCSLLKAACERLSFRRRSERHSIEPRTEKQRSTIQPSNPEIQPGNQFDSCDRADNIAARLVGLFIAIVSFRRACA